MLNWLLLFKKQVDIMAKESVTSLIKKELGLTKIGGIEKKEEEVIKKDEGKKRKEVEGEKKREKNEEKAVEEVKEKEEKKTEGGKEERKTVGNLTIDQCIKIAKIKSDDLLAKTLKKAVKEVVGACVSMPITIEGKNPKDVLNEIDKGIYDTKLGE